MKKVAFSILLAFLSTTGFSQLIPIPIEQKIQQSALVLEGKVVGQKSFVADDGEVYTENRIEISQILKGAYEQHEISVLTWGGKIDDYEVTWTHLASLAHNQFGVFFLVPTVIGVPHTLLNNRQFYDIYASAAFGEYPMNLMIILAPKKSCKVQLYTPVRSKSGYC